MMDPQHFVALLAKYTKVDKVGMQDVLFGSGLNLSSIGFTEFIMKRGRDYDATIDFGDLDASISPAGLRFGQLNAAH